MIDSCQTYSELKCVFFLQMSKGDFHVVELVGVSMPSGENIFPSEKVRPRNVNPPVTAKTFVRVEIEVPEDIRD